MANRWSTFKPVAPCGLTCSSVCCLLLSFAHCSVLLLLSFWELASNLMYVMYIMFVAVGVLFMFVSSSALSR